MTSEADRDPLRDFVRALKARSADYAVGIPARCIPITNETQPKAVPNSACCGLRIRCGDPKARRLFFALGSDLTNETLELFGRIVERGLGLRMVDVALYEIQIQAEQLGAGGDSSAILDVGLQSSDAKLVVFNFEWSLLEQFLARNSTIKPPARGVDAARVLQTFSLHEIASDPAKKKIFWTALQNQVP
jgi:hypothetical protein